MFKTGFFKNGFFRNGFFPSSAFSPDTFIIKFKELFDRGQFNYGEVVPQIRDKDIAEAKEEADCVFNEGLIGDEDCAEKALLHLTAHFLQLDSQAADGSGQSAFLQTSRSADGISEAVHLPTWMRNSDFAMYATTHYGQKFLVISKPYIDGGVWSVKGGTRF